MGLLNAKNIAKAKDLALKNKDKLAPAVTKATSAIDKKTGGKHADKLKKLDEAAAKISGTAPKPGAERSDAASPATPTTFDAPLPE
jgi:hypothetical protein